MRKMLIIIMVLLSGSTMIFSQNFTPDFELTVNPPPDIFSFMTDILELKSGDFIASYRSDAATNLSGLIKISADGDVLYQKTFSEENYKIASQTILIETKDNGLIAMLSMDPIESDSGIICFNKINEDLNVISAKCHRILIDKTPDHGFQYPRLKLFSAFEAEDGGIWACVLKSVPENLPPPGTLGNDSVFFCRFDYEGNLLDKKSAEFIGFGNRYSFHASVIVPTSEGYSMILSSLRGINNQDRRLVLQNYDRNFNFINEVERSLNNPDFYLPEISAKLMSSGNILVSSTYTNPTMSFAHRLSLTEFDKELKKKHQLIYTATYPDYPFLSASSSVDFLDENRIFWAFTDHDNFGANFDIDTWAYIYVFNANLEVEQVLFYDFKGENSYLKLESMKVTRDGGIVIAGLFNDFVNAHGDMKGLIVKFPPEAFLSIEDAHASGLKTAIAYPNPGNNTLNIRTSLKDAVVEVYDIQGRMVYNQDIAENITPVSTENWNSGMYLWRVVKDGKECESGKWVKD